MTFKGEVAVQIPSLDYTGKRIKLRQHVDVVLVLNSVKEVDRVHDLLHEIVKTKEMLSLKDELVGDRLGDHFSEPVPKGRNNFIIIIWARWGLHLC